MYGGTQRIHRRWRSLIGMKELTTLIFLFVGATAFSQNTFQENLELIVKDSYNTGQLPKELLQEADSIISYSIGHEYIAVLVTETNGLKLQYDSLNGHPSIHFLTGEYMFVFGSKYWMRTIDMAIDEEKASIKYIIHSSGFSEDGQKRKCYSGMIKAKKILGTWKTKNADFKNIECSKEKH